MKNLLKFLPVFLVFLTIFLFSVQKIFAISESECNNNWQNNLDECINLWEGLRYQESQKVISLKTELKRIDTSIAITQARIYQTAKEIENLEKEIDSLTGKIGKLDLSLDEVSKLLAKRIAETYKKSKIDYLNLFFSSKNFPEFVSRFKYLKVIQLHDRNLMLQMETARTNFEDQKSLKEEKQKELEVAKKKNESLTIILAQQRKEKDSLLKEGEKRIKDIQGLINKAIAEQAAINGILAGRGKESKVGDVSEGQKIASIIQYPSCNSSGAHLHFMVIKDGNAQNPFNYLKGGISYKNCSGVSPGCNSADPFNPSGTWNWPINETIIFNQGFGKTWALDNYAWLRGIYSSHDGIDIDSSSSEVKAVRAGTLYRGIYSGISSCNLQYVHVRHNDDNLDTYYLHVNY